jgi:hypothetical protein
MDYENDRAYLFDGYNSSATLGTKMWVYDMSTAGSETCSTTNPVSSSTFARTGTGSPAASLYWKGAVRNDKIYLINCQGNPAGEVYIYDLTDDTWSSGTTNPDSVVLATMPAYWDGVSQFMYIWEYNSPYRGYVYDMDNDTWTQLTASMSDRYGWGWSAIHDGAFWKMGSVNIAGNDNKDVIKATY